MAVGVRVVAVPVACPKPQQPKAGHGHPRIGPSVTESAPDQAGRPKQACPKLVCRAAHHKRSHADRARPGTTGLAGKIPHQARSVGSGALKRQRRAVAIAIPATGCEDPLRRSGSGRGISEQ